MNGSPFNACDYLCEKCKETENCGVYAVLREKATSKQLTGKAEDQPGSFLEDVKESLDEAMEMLEKIAAVLNIDLNDIEDIDNLDRYYIDRDELYQLSLTFTTKTHAFLKKIEPHMKPETKDAFEDLIWYHTLVSVKTHRAISSDYEGMTDDAINSASVAVKSLIKCIQAFGIIEQRYLVASEECRSLSRTAVSIKGEIQKRYIGHAKPDKEWA